MRQAMKVKQKFAAKETVCEFQRERPCKLTKHEVSSESNMMLSKIVFKNWKSEVMLSLS